MKRFFKSILVALPFCLLACQPTDFIVLDSSKEDTETRIATMRKIIEPLAALPTDILDAHYFEYKMGSGLIGPSDYSFYAKIKVPEGSAKKWGNKIEEIKPDFLYASPQMGLKWWLGLEDFEDIVENSPFYATKTYFGRHGGWMIIDEKTHTIYVHTFTM